MPSRKPTFDFDEAYWGFNPADEDTIVADEEQPAANKRINGWVKEVPPYKFFNWMLTRLFRFMFWAHQGVVPQFTSLREALGAGSSPIVSPYLGAGELFATINLQNDTLGDVDANNETVIDGFNDVQAMACDGRLLYIGYDTFVEARRLDDIGTALWQVDHSGGQDPVGLAANGRAVAAVFNGGVDEEVFTFDPEDGTEISKVEIGSAVVAVDMTGDYVLEVHGNIGYVREWNDLAVVESSANHGAALACCCMTKSRGVIAGARNGSSQDFAIFDLVTGAILQHVGISVTTGTPYIRDCCTDGTYLYFCGDQITDGGKDYTVWCYTMLGNSSPDLVWRGHADESAQNICVDDRYLYVSTAASEFLSVFDKKTGVRVLLIDDALGAANPRTLCTDGDLIYGATGGELRIFQRGRQAQLWLKENPAISVGHPFFNLATPVSEG